MLLFNQPDIYLFNGDADGICAARQLWQLFGKGEVLTGIKRDHALLSRLSLDAPRRIFVLDLPVEKNLAALEAQLEIGSNVIWFDHHRSSHLPQHPHLQLFIKESADTNTSLLVAQQLQTGDLWAIVGLFGDDIPQTALQIGAKLSLTAQQMALLQQLGVLLNYNSYGEVITDLWFHPADLFARLQPFNNPFDFISQETVFQTLQQGFEQDHQSLSQTQFLLPNLAILPNQAWARRISGTFAYEFLCQFPHQGVAVLVEKERGDFLVSVRAPKSAQFHAGEFCAQFPTGGGRASAGGINQLPKERLTEFQQSFAKITAPRSFHSSP